MRNSFQVLDDHLTEELSKFIKKMITFWAQEEQDMGNYIFHWNILSNNAVKSVAAYCPTSEEELITLGVFGEAKRKEYGERLVKAILRFMRMHNVSLEYVPSKRPVKRAKLESTEDNKPTSSKNKDEKAIDGMDKTSLDSASRNNSLLDNDTETIGETQNGTSSEIPSPKRQRLETMQSVSDETQQPPFSPDPRHTSVAPVKVVSSHTQCGAPKSPVSRNLATSSAIAVSTDSQPGTFEYKEQLLNRKREKLTNMLKQRLNEYSNEHRIIIKLREQIEKIDEELIELIMAEE